MLLSCLERLMKQTKPELKKVNHDGHRKRVKDKIADYGLKSLQPHEVLEYLLWFTIPRKDTNPLGHELIDKFGSLANVLNADPNSLEKINGISQNTARFLTSLPELFTIYKQSVSDGKNDILQSSSDCIRYFRSKFEIGKFEDFYVICMNGQNKVISQNVMKGSNDVSVQVDTNLFTQIINNKNTVKVLVFHTHPYGDCSPSVADTETTKTLIRLCFMLNKQLCDHIIFNGNNHFSFGANKLLDKLVNNILKDDSKHMPVMFKSQKFSPFSYTDTIEQGTYGNFYDLYYTNPNRQTQKK